jgi:two-component system NtrC family response regulator
MFTILIVDDEQIQRESLSGFFEKQKFDVITASNGKEAIGKISILPVDIILCDYKMPDISGIEVLKYAKAKNPDISVIIVTAYGNIENAVESMKLGAHDFIQKPIDLDVLRLIVEKLIERKNLISENRELRSKLMDKFKFSEIVSQNIKMEEALNIAARISKSKATVLLRGESGTGKELFAKAIHYSSDRKDKPFIVINCSSFAETLIESELFGHEKGSFTGADKQRIGKLELANTGTLFIDEVGDISLQTQVKLLRFLQSGEIERIGGNEKKLLDVRIIAATNKDLEFLISEQKFREDFFYRINVITITIPPLRERKSDIALLIDYFVKKFGKENNKENIIVSKEAFNTLMKYEYPGNVRELENIIERCVVLARNNIITTNELPINVKELKSEKISDFAIGENETLPDYLEKIEKEYVLRALERTNGNKSKAAEMLGLSERNLRYRLKKWGY